MKLYCNQVYVADNPTELIPEFLTLLKGVIDCPDLPLNVSRSFLQNDPQARKIKEHIAKKVADRLTGMAKTERETYEKYWDDIAPFVKYGMMRDTKFADRMKEFLIFRTSEGTHTTLDAYLERMKEKTGDKIIYVQDEAMQASYLSMLKEAGVEAVIAPTMIDQHFIPYFEMQSAGKYKFQRVDSDVLDHIIEREGASKIVDPADNKTNDEKILGLFEKYLGDRKVTFRIEGLKSDKVPAMLIFDENMRRMKEMGGFGGGFASLTKDLELKETLVVNRNSAAVKNLLSMTKKLVPNEQNVQMLVQHIYDLAALQQRQFTPQTMQSFLERTAVMLGGFGSDATS